MKNNSVLEIIVELGRQRETGKLVLVDADRMIRVGFEQGLIQALSSNLEGYQLEDYFAAARLMPAREMAKFVKKSLRRGESLGTAALHRDLVNLKELVDILRQQAFQLLYLALTDGFGVDTFEKCGTVYPGTGTRLSPWEIMIQLARDCSEPKNLSPDALVSLCPFENAATTPTTSQETSDWKTPSSHVQSILRESPEYKSGDLSHVPWSPAELSILSLFNGPVSVRDLPSKTGLSEEMVAEVLATLTWVGVCRVSDQRLGILPGSNTRLALKSLIPRQAPARLTEKLAVVNDAGSFASEQFNLLKVRLDGLETEEPIQVLAVVSGHMQDGKSLASTNLAFCFAKDPGRRVVLVDCDLRCPSLQDYLNVPLEPGLSNFLNGEPLAASCYLRRVNDLYFLTAGGLVENPVELLSHPRLKELINFLRENFDLVILDCPPLQPISDTARITRFADGILMVIRRGRTPYTSVERSMRFLERDKLLGVVFNDVEPQLFNTYYYHSYYGYGRKKSNPYYPSSRGNGKG